jgi:hypothetical protein
MTLHRYYDLAGELRLFNSDDTKVCKVKAKPLFSGIPENAENDYGGCFVYEVREEIKKGSFLPEGYVLVRSYSEHEEKESVLGDRKRGISQEFRLIRIPEAQLFIQALDADLPPEMLDYYAHAKIQASQPATKNDTKLADENAHAIEVARLYTEWANGLDMLKRREYFGGKRGRCSQKTIAKFKDAFFGEEKYLTHRKKLKHLFNSKLDETIRNVLKMEDQANLSAALDAVISRAKKKRRI